MNILITNDDGISAVGIRALAAFLRAEHKVFIVAPDNERSGVSQSITYRRPIFVKQFKVDEEQTGFGVNGYPADCVKLALAELCPFKPDLVVSGINNGLNVGLNVGYSGTVAGALAGAAMGFRSVALSIESNDNPDNFTRAIELAWPICAKLVADGHAFGHVININVPLKALTQPHDWLVVPMNPNPMGTRFMHGNDPNGRPFFWQTNDPAPVPLAHLTDTEVVAAGNISVTPLTHDLSLHTEIARFQQILYRDNPQAPKPRQHNVR